MDILNEIEEVRKRYEEDDSQSSFNLLLLGEMGTGKTFLARTARKPVHIDSFDPGGTKGLAKWVKRGEIVADTRYESEDRTSPKWFRRWEKTTEERIRSGYFNYFGTYVLDSSTSWSEAIMNQLLLKAGIAGEAPRWAKDYVPQKVAIQNWVKKLLNLQCDFILTGHLKLVEDPIDGKHKFRYMTTGQGMIIIPTLFDEVYVTLTKETSKGVEYQLLTANIGTYAARSRLKADGKLETYEEPDLKGILKKAGRDYSDKPPLSLLRKEAERKEISGTEGHN